MENLKWYTGYLPREIQMLKEKGNFHEFKKYRTNEFGSKANQLYNTCSDVEQQHYNKFLRKLLVPHYRGHVGDVMNVGSFYDKGLFYKSPFGFECISGPARIALTPLLSSKIFPQSIQLRFVYKR